MLKEQKLLLIPNHFFAEETNNKQKKHQCKHWTPEWFQNAMHLYDTSNAQDMAWLVCDQ